MSDWENVREKAGRHRETDWEMRERERGRESERERGSDKAYI